MDSLKKLPQMIRDTFLIALVSIGCHLSLEYLHPDVYMLSVPVILGVYVILWRGMVLQMGTVREQADRRIKQADKRAETAKELYEYRNIALVRVVNTLLQLYVRDPKNPAARKRG